MQFAELNPYDRLELDGSALPGYFRGRWERMRLRQWTTPSGKNIQVNAKRVSPGDAEHEYIYVNSNWEVTKVG